MKTKRYYPVLTSRGFEVSDYVGLPSSKVFETREACQAEIDEILDFELSQRDEIRHGA